MANNEGVPEGLGALLVWRFAVVRWPWIVRTIEDRSSGTHAAPKPLLQQPNLFWKILRKSNFISTIYH